MDDNLNPIIDTARGTGTSRVVVTIPPDPDRLELLRSVATALAVALDFDIDTLADLRMAVDELCSMAMKRARPNSEMCVRFETGDGAVSVLAEVPVSEPATVDEDSFGWMVLQTLADSVAWTAHSGGVENQRLEVRLRMQRRQEPQ